MIHISNSCYKLCSKILHFFFRIGLELTISLNYYRGFLMNNDILGDSTCSVCSSKFTFWRHRISKYIRSRFWWCKWGKSFSVSVVLSRFLLLNQRSKNSGNGKRSNCDYSHTLFLIQCEVYITRSLLWCCCPQLLLL